MCKDCQQAGCRHDWQEWTPREFEAGYEDAMTGRQYQPGNLTMVSLSGCAAGYTAGQIDAGKRDFEEGEQAS